MSTIDPIQEWFDAVDESGLTDEDAERCAEQTYEQEQQLSQRSYAARQQYIDLREQNVGAVEVIERLATRFDVTVAEMARMLRGTIADTFIERYFPEASL